MRRALRAVAVLVGSLIVLLGALWGASQSPAAKRFFARQLSQRLSRPDFVVRIGTLSGWIPFEIGANELTIADAHGPWLTLRDVFLQWRPMALLSGRIHIELLSARHLHITRSPSTPDRPPERNSQPIQWSVPEYPLPVILDRILVHQAVLDAPVTGMPLIAALNGSLTLDENNQTQRGFLKIATNHAQRETSLTVEVTLQRETPRLRGQITFSEEQSGWVSSRFDLKDVGPIQGTMHVHMNASTDPARILGIDALELRARAVMLSAHGAMDLATGALKALSYRLNVEDLGELSPLFGFSVRGKGVAEGTIEGPLSQVTGELALRLSALARPSWKLSEADMHLKWTLKRKAEASFPEVFVTMSGKTSSLETRGAVLPGMNHLFVETSAMLTHEGTVNIQKFRVDLPDLGEAELTGWADLRGRTLDCQSTIALSDLSAFSPLAPQPLQGDVHGEGFLSGPWDNMTVHTTLRGSALGYGQARWKDWNVEIAASGLPGHPKGQITSRALYADSPWTVDVDFAKDGPMLSLPRLSFHCQDASGEGSIRTHLETWLSSGALRVSIPKLEIFQPLFEMPLRGALKGAIYLDDENARQKMRGNLTAHALTIADVDVDSANFSVQLDSIGPSPSGKMLLTVHNLQKPPLTVATAQGTVEGGPEELAFSSQIRGHLRHPFSLKTMGSARIQSSVTDLRFKVFSMRSGPVDIQLESPVDVRLNKRNVETSPVKIRAGKGRVVAQVQWNPENPLASLEWENIPLELMEHLGGPSLEGRFNGQGTLQQVRGIPHGTMKVQVSNLRHATWPPSETLSLKGTARARAESLFVEAALFGLGSEPTRARVSLPVRFQVDPFAFRVLKDQPMSGTLSVAAALEQLGRLFNLDEHQIRGLLHGQLNFDGTLSRPNLSGDVQLDQGRYEHEDFGIVLEEITAVADGTGDRVRLREFKASDGKKGSIRGSGECRLDPEAGFPYEVRLTLEDASPLHRDDISGNADGAVTIHGSLQETILQGALRVRPLRLILPERLPANVVDLHVEEIGGREKPSSRATQQNSPADFHRIILDLSIDFPGMTTVSGWGLESEWKGTLSLSGEASRPLLTGRFDVIRGQLDFLTRRFRLTEGQVILYGDVPPDPMLNILAETPLRDMTAQVRVSGRSSQPRLTVESRPQRPQDEVLAQILFGRSATALSPFQAIRLARILHSLSSASGRGLDLDIIGKTRDILGLSHLELLGQKTGKDLQVGLGKYLGENVRVDVNQRLEEGDVSLRVEVELTPNITLETQLGTESRTGAGVFWKYDY